jgi:hypothetical protein
LVPAGQPERVRGRGERRRHEVGWQRTAGGRADWGNPPQHAGLCEPERAVGDQKAIVLVRLGRRYRRAADHLGVQGIHHEHLTGPVPVGPDDAIPGEQRWYVLGAADVEARGDPVGTPVQGPYPPRPVGNPQRLGDGR